MHTGCSYQTLGQMGFTSLGLMTLLRPRRMLLCSIKALLTIVHNYTLNMVDNSPWNCLIGSQMPLILKVKNTNTQCKGNPQTYNSMPE